MRILQVHNFYQQPGGEDQVYGAEYALLTQNGHEVYQYEARNEAIKPAKCISVAFKSIWNSRSYRELKTLISQKLPDVIHVHNTFPLISPAVYYAAAATRTPIVQTLHNYRLLCPAATLFRDGSVCEKCVGSVAPYKSVWHRCYRNSACGSAAVTSMLFAHRIAGTWTRRVQAYIVLSEFSRRKFVEGGLPAEKIVVKPNFLAVDPGPGHGSGQYALFVGRLSEEKGIATLVRAWKTLQSEIWLRIVGDGPLAPWLKREIQSLKNVEWVGRCERQRVFALIKEAAFIVFPSQWFEGLPMTIVEALACGTPVLASAVGSMNELITDGINGYHFAAGDSNDLMGRVTLIMANPEKLHAMRQSSRLSYELSYTAERNYNLLLDIYRRAIHFINDKTAFDLKLATPCLKQ